MVDKKKTPHKTLTVSVETYEDLDKLKKRMERDLKVELSWEQFLSRWASKESK